MAITPMGANNYYDVLQRLRNVLRTRGSRRELYIRDLELQLKQLFTEHAAEKTRLHVLKDKFVKKSLQLEQELQILTLQNVKLRESSETARKWRNVTTKGFSVSNGGDTLFTHELRVVAMVAVCPH